MTSYKYIRLIAFAALPFAIACNKKFLEVTPQGQVTEDQALKDPNAATELVGGVYNTLYFGGFDKNTVGFEWVMVTDVASDDGDKGSTPSDFDINGAGDIDNFKANANNGIFNNLWLGYYTGIARANLAIDILNKSTFDSTTKNRLLGESRFIRGLYYFNLVRCFGGVPKILRYPEPSELNEDEFQTRASAADIYSVIIDDLQFGVDHLPLKGDASTQVGRANKATAESFLAKVYLYQKNWQKAFDLTKDIIDSKLYSLVPDYSLIFREHPVNGIGGNNNTESIFEVQTVATPSEGSASPLFSNGQGPRAVKGWDDLGFGFNNPTTDLAAAYESGDTRKNATIIFINPTVAAPGSIGTVLWDGYRIPSQDSVVNQRYNYKAYHSPIAESAQQSGNKDKKPKNIRLMRYSEVLLIYAEAAAMLGNEPEATDKLNMVRERAGIGDVAGTQENIWKERRVELAMEEDRFFDLVRQGRAASVMQAQGKAFKAGTHELFPIPQVQRDLSGGRLTQNNGY